MSSFKKEPKKNSININNMSYEKHLSINTYNQNIPRNNQSRLNTPQIYPYLDKNVKKSSFYRGSIQSNASNTPSPVIGQSDKSLLKKNNKDNKTDNNDKIKLNMNEVSSSISYNNIFNSNDNYYVNFLNNLYKDDERLNITTTDKKINQNKKKHYHSNSKDIGSMNLVINTYKSKKISKRHTATENSINQLPKRKQKNSCFFELKNNDKIIIKDIRKSSFSKKRQKKNNSNINLTKKTNLVDNNNINIRTGRNSLKEEHRIPKSKKNSQIIFAKKTKKTKMDTDSSINSINKIQIKNQIDNQINDMDKDQDQGQDENQSKEGNIKKININKKIKKIKLKNWLTGLCCFLGEDEE